jgi:hypothetical protein
MKEKLGTTAMNLENLKVLPDVETPYVTVFNDTDHNNKRGERLGIGNLGCAD